MIREEIKDELLVELAIWRETGKPTEKIVKLFFEIAEYQFNRYCSRYNINKEDKEDMIASAVLSCCEQLPKIKQEHFDKILTYLMIIVRSYYVGKWLKIYKERCNNIDFITYSIENI